VLDRRLVDAMTARKLVVHTLRQTASGHRKVQQSVFPSSASTFYKEPALQNAAALSPKVPLVVAAKAKIGEI